MQIIIDVAEEKQAFVLELLTNFSFVSIKSPLQTNNDDALLTKTELVNDIREALQEVKQHRAGAKKLRSAWDLLDEI